MMEQDKRLRIALSANDFNRSADILETQANSLDATAQVLRNRSKDMRESAAELLKFLEGETE